MDYTIITCFFNIGRENWKIGMWKNRYDRPLQVYMDNGKRVMSLDDKMVVYTTSEFVDFVKECRSKYLDKTEIIELNLHDLPYYKYKEKMDKIIRETDFSKDKCKFNIQKPEFIYSDYVLLVWSKLFLVNRSNPFQTPYLVWLDFGIPTNILTDLFLNKKFLKNGVRSDKIRLSYIYPPNPEDLNLDIYRDVEAKLTAGFITGSVDSFKQFEELFNHEAKYLLENNIVCQEQYIYTRVYLKNPDLFNIYYSGLWTRVITNYFLT